jgi:acyl-coenzyme A synthetase/AMP-(fatty) acid ligase
LPAPGETPETLPPQEIINFCMEKIARFKVPRYIEYVTDFPRSTSDKIQKQVLIAQKADNLAEDCYDRFGSSE